MHTGVQVSVHTRVWLSMYTIIPMSVTCMSIPVSICPHLYHCARQACPYPCPYVHIHTRVNDLQVHTRVRVSTFIAVCMTCMSIPVSRCPRSYLCLAVTVHNHTHVCDLHVHTRVQVSTFIPVSGCHCAQSYPCL